MKITVLCGGDGGERAVSLVSGERVFTALSARGHETCLIDWRGELPPRCLSRLKESDAVFLALHGGKGEGGALQAALEENGVYHYTGTRADAAALAMDKARAKKTVARVGVPTARGGVWLPGGDCPPLEAPIAVKALSGGSSEGLSILRSAEEIRRFQPTVPVLAEAYLSGREYTVGVLDGEVLPVVEISVDEGLYDYEHKYRAGAATELCPAPISTEKAAHLHTLAQKAFRALGLRDVARIDFKENDKGAVFFLEANTLPGMTATSLLPLAACAAGYSFGALCEKMAELAREHTALT